MGLRYNFFQKNAIFWGKRAEKVYCPITKGVPRRGERLCMRGLFCQRKKCTFAVLNENPYNR